MKDGVLASMLAWELHVDGLVARQARRAARHGVVWTQEHTRTLNASEPAVVSDPLATRAALPAAARRYKLAYEATVRRYGYPICRWQRSVFARLWALRP